MPSAAAVFLSVSTMALTLPSESRDQLLESVRQAGQTYAKSGLVAEARERFEAVVADAYTRLGNEDPELLLVHADILSMTGDHDAGHELFERVPDDSLSLAHHLFNRIQTRFGDEDYVATQVLLERFMELHEPSHAADWVHDSFAQSLAPELRGPALGEDLPVFLEDLRDSESTALGDMVSGLHRWASLQRDAADQEGWRRALRERFDAPLAYGPRYRLLIAGHCLSDPTLHEVLRGDVAIVLEELFRELTTAWKTVDGDASARVRRARSRYWAAHCAWLRASLEESSTDGWRHWMRQAFDASPDAKDRQVRHAYFYERATLGGLPEFRTAFARHLEESGEMESAIEAWSSIALDDPSHKAALQACYQSWRPDGDFEEFWTQATSREWKPLPSFRLVGLDGSEHSAEELEGRWALLDFWGTWCTPCRKELPAVNRFFEDVRAQEGRSLVWTFACHDQEDSVRAFMEEQGYSFPVLLEAEGVAKLFGATGFPHKVLISPAGTYRTLAFGEDWEATARQFLFDSP